jgi:hypothetical protein
MWKSPTGLAVLVLALGCIAVRGDDARKAPDDPDAGFLEFLGSVDRLAEVNPDYLSQAGATKAATPGGKPVPAPPAQASPPPPPPLHPAPPQPLPPSASNASGGPNRE